MNTSAIQIWDLVDVKDDFFEPAIYMNVVPVVLTMAMSALICGVLWKNSFKQERKVTTALFLNALLFGVSAALLLAQMSLYLLLNTLKIQISIFWCSMARNFLWPLLYRHSFPLAVFRFLNNEYANKMDNTIVGLLFLPFPLFHVMIALSMMLTEKTRADEVCGFIIQQEEAVRGLVYLSWLCDASSVMFLFKVMWDVRRFKNRVRVDLNKSRQFANCQRAREEMLFCVVLLIYIFLPYGYFGFKCLYNVLSRYRDLRDEVEIDWLFTPTTNQWVGLVQISYLFFFVRPIRQAFVESMKSVMGLQNFIGLQAKLRWVMNLPDPVSTENNQDSIFYIRHMEFL